MTPVASVNGVIAFDEGLPGFEASRRFVLVTSPALAPFTLIQGVDEGTPSFLALDPRLVDPDYASPLADSDLVRLRAAHKTPLLWLVLITILADGSATANLNAPIVINPEVMRGIQLVAPDSPYLIDHPLPPV
jgi:flagellar assembly factor FliW